MAQIPEGDELPGRYELAKGVFCAAQKERGEPALMLYARYMVGNSLYWMGKFSAARENLETAITYYDPERNRTLALRFEGYDAQLINLLLLELGAVEARLSRASDQAEQ